MKSCRKFAVYSEFRSEYYKEPGGEGCTSIYYKFIWQFMVVDDLLDDSIYKILCRMGFVDRYQFAIFGETIYCNKDTIIAGIIDKVLGFK